MQPVEDLGADVFAIDTRMAGNEGITSSYLIRGAAPALIETGTALSAPTVIGALANLGVDADHLATIVVTHIHLDHAGGVGDLAAAFPQARIVVHEAGARHLVDPTRLLASARLVFGDLMDSLFGDLQPTDPARITAVVGDEQIDLGEGRYLTAVSSPGHARHHIGLLDSQTGDLYVGDAAGLVIPETGTQRPSTPPPDFDLDKLLASLEAFRQRQPTRLLFSHFGPVANVDETLDAAAEEVLLWVSLAREARANNLDLDHAVTMATERTAQRYAALRARPDVAEKFEQLSSTAANLSGILHWLDKVEAEHRS